MPRHIRLGVIVPSSNTALEPLTQQIVAFLNADPTFGLLLSVHFARVRVTTISLSADADAQFALSPMLDAAQLLADARVNVIGWSGTSASWLGFAADDALCTAIEEATGIPATTAVRGMNSLLQQQRRPHDTVGLVTPYTPDVNKAIQENYAAAGLTISDGRSRYTGWSDNITFANLDEPTLDAMVDDVVRHGAQTVLIMCTNVRAAQRVQYWERQHDIQVLDSVATTVTAMLDALGIEVKSASAAEAWGKQFQSS
ncbi:maleate isomerase [Sporothrix schenckii 1099-18]|uniref:Asp/Glu/hydantoin racemase n=2 Tax=Sporothrix schenckii TaxID=29908 RepID=U7PI79_SPOS1|nr:maleate isomerase [Sporothrix schenckii 1099-18]ERS95308.1 hypothetical protein HMPREF1624_08186 [Sporothrix schenckii ATCC 58251]KJR87583.1 maleate isomerase [Sporothrix schenckii 1099-18]